MNEARARRTWPPLLTVAPIAQAQGEVRLPGSKSLSNRALLLAALATGSTRLTGLLDADDTRVMVDALRQLGVAIAVDGDTALVDGCAGRFPVRHAELSLGNAGTAMRPLAAVLAFAAGTYRLDGVARMRERPIGDLVDALVDLGARIRYLERPGFPPLLIEPAAAAADSPAPGGADVRMVRVRGDVSSQFLSALLMAAPVRAGAGLRIEVQGRLISRPYVAMTVEVMRRFGARIECDGDGYFVGSGRYRAPGSMAIEGDASGASYFLALGAIAGGPVRVLGVGRDSIQGDLAFCEVLEKMGARVQMGADWISAAGPPASASAALARSTSAPLRAIDLDATAIPDAAMTAAVLGLFARGTTRLEGIGSWRVKETDRIAAMATELARFGAAVEQGPDWLAVAAPPAPQHLRAATVDTYDDHRMAMCLALAAAGGVGVGIRDPGCVAKTFPDYFEQLDSLRAPRRP